MRNISVYLVIFMVATAVRTEMTSKELHDKIMGISNTCIKQTGINQELVDSVAAGDFRDDPKVKEHLLCIARTSGFLTEDGKFQVDNIRSNIMNVFDDKAIVDAIIDTCAQDQATPEETAYQWTKCSYKQYQKYASA